MTSWPIGGGEMGERIRAMDWSLTPLGPIESWPPTLRGTLGLCIASPLPMAIAWGPQHVMLYNDGHRPLCGLQHPAALGRDFVECGTPLWPTLREVLAGALAGRSERLESQPLFLDCNGSWTEAIFSGAFSPIRDEHGSVVGVLTSSQEITGTVRGGRCAQTLGDLTGSLAGARTWWEVFTRAAGSLGSHERDVPFALLYLREGSGWELAASTEPTGPPSPPPWPFEEVLRAGGAFQVEVSKTHWDLPRRGPYSRARLARLLPLGLPDQDPPRALLVLGMSPGLELDLPYRVFQEQLAATVATAMARAGPPRRPPARSVPAPDPSSDSGGIGQSQLETMQHVLLNAISCIAIHQGPEHVYEFANARYRSLAHRPTPLGRPMLEVFPELRGQEFLGLMDRVYHSGENLRGQELLVRWDRTGQGVLEESFFNYSFQPIKQREGQVTGVLTALHEVTGWVKARQQAEQRAAELEAVIQSIPYGVSIADTTGIIRTNRVARELSGSIGAEEPLRRALRGESSTREVHVHPAGRPQEIIIRSTTVPVRSREELVGAVSIHMDITELKHAADERESLLASEQSARSEAERANRMKDEFLARISHELATPALGMRLWLETLEKDESKRTEALAALRQCMQAHSKIVHDLLDTERALNGKLTLSLEACEPGEPLEAAVSALRPLAEQSGVQLTVEVLDPPLVQADPVRLRQILSNLVSNALKFTPAGGRVGVTLEPRLGGVCFIVRDTGRGYPSQFQPLLFSPFRQAEEGTTRSKGGLGLGLSIVRQLVELHGGKVWADSPGPGKGATFTVWLPVLGEPGEDAATRALEHVDRQLEGLCLLLVEDDALTRQAVASVLEQQGARVRAVEGAAAALELLCTTASPVDAVLCDLAMPGEDGYSFIRKLRALDSPLRRLPAAAFTAHMGEKDRVQALLAGFQLHIPKSVEPPQLVASIRALVRDAPPRPGTA